MHCHVLRYTGRRDGLEPSERKKLDILTKMFKPRCDLKDNHLKPYLEFNHGYSIYQNEVKKTANSIREIC